MRQPSRRFMRTVALLAAAACGGGDDDAGTVSMDSVPDRKVMNEAVSVAPAPASLSLQREERASARRMRADVGSVEGSQAAAPQAPPLASQLPAAAGPASSTAMLIRTAKAAVEVKALDPAVAAARRAAARWGGVIANAQVETGRHELHRAMLQIRVPAAGFDSLLAGLAPLGRVESVQVSAQDVGEEYVDTEARVANLRRLEARMVDLLVTRTGRLSDVLGVERELARVRGEIEQIEGRRRYLERSVAMSTLDLALHEPAPIVAGTPGSNPIAAALRDAWRYFVASIAWGISALGVLVPVVAVAAGGWLLVRRLLSRTALSTGEGGSAP
jgi:hypothetical protein